MSNIGKFLKKNFLNKIVELYTADDTEWISYSDGDSLAYSIIIAKVIDYDDDSGVITLENSQKQRFYVNEWHINVFCVHGSGFKLIENINSTIKTGKKLSKDFM